MWHVPWALVALGWLVASLLIILAFWAFGLVLVGLVLGLVLDGLVWDCLWFLGFGWSVCFCFEDFEEYGGSRRA